MKVGIDHTIEVSDEQRVKLADVLDKKQSRREATRQEFKAYIWDYGRTWDQTLEEEWDAMFKKDYERVVEDDDDEPEDDEDFDLSDLI